MSSKKLGLTVVSSFATAVLLTILTSGFMQESHVASENVPVAAQNFEVNRRCIFYNGITGEYMLTVEGRLSVKESDSQRRLEVIVKTGHKTYKKHYLGLSDNVSYFVEQLDPIQADDFRSRIVFRPTEIIPDVEVKLP